MQGSDLKDIAQQVIRLHGLRAQAVALERAAECRAQGQTEEHDRWQAIHSLICELKRTAREEHGGGGIEGKASPTQPWL